MFEGLSAKKILVIILLLAAFLRLYRINYPNAYVFDEVYHAFTAKEYLLGHKEAWEWWNTPPPGVAYEWTHPPLAKEVMAASMFLVRSTDAWAYRFPGILLGIFSVYMIYLLGKLLFKEESAGLIAAFIFSLDGLNFVQSRTGMNDIYFVTFMLVSLFFFLKKRYFYSALFLGLTLASKWAGIYLVGLYLLLIFNQIFKEFRAKNLNLKNYLGKLYLLFIPPIVYFISYIPLFLQGDGLDIFWGLQKQMWWYHTGLKATHDYASPWWSWPLNLYPVWYFVEYHKNNTISNIFTSGNPALFWVGSGAILVSIWDFWKTKSHGLFISLLGFFVFWLPWAVSPRIMFLYHFSPSVPFLSLILGYQIHMATGRKNDKLLLGIILGLIVLGFIFVYPLLTGIPLPKNILELFFKSNLTKNPFG
ncbi:phospholipid carrier-dependent glycosyltransferase [Candidatus Daviesbacteria bacterium]|nr:phospholipid carrier-dependent glycosyltransferase [Candidatus Daviesbacteria bacterium]